MDDGTSCAFFPQKDCISVPSKYVWEVRGRAGLIRCFRITFKNDGFTLIYFHGNGELVSKVSLRSEVKGLPNMRDMFDEALEAPFGLSEIVLVEYGGYGSTFGKGPATTVSSVLMEAEDVLEHLGLQDNRVIVMGRSIGSIPAVHLIRIRPQLGGLILESAMTDQAGYFSRKAENRQNSLPESLTQVETTLRSYSGPVLLLHCSDDEVFPFEENAAKLFHWCQGPSSSTVNNNNNNKFIPTIETTCSTTKLQTEHDCTLQLACTGRSVKALVCFESGGHNFIFPFNWPAYAHCFLAFVSGSVDSVTAEVKSSWWSLRTAKIHQEETGHSKVKSLCIVS